MKISGKNAIILEKAARAASFLAEKIVFDRNLLGTGREPEFSTRGILDRRCGDCGRDCEAVSDRQNFQFYSAPKGGAC